MPLTFPQLPSPELDGRLSETIAKRDERDTERPRLRLVDPGRVDVALVTEGTYPHGDGGVSVWCDQLVHGLTDYRFRVAALTAFGHQQPVYELPDHMTDLRTVGLWDGPVRHDTSTRGTPGPLARQLADLLVAPDDDPTGFVGWVDALVARPTAEITAQLRFGELLPALDAALGARAPRRELDPGLEGVRLADMVQVAHMLDHLLRPLTADLGPADVYHASSNGLSALACMVARRRYGGAFLLTEHGIYLRERYLELRRLPLARPARALLVRFHRLVCAAGYADATIVQPCNLWNTRWETRFGTRRRQLRTIYNGVNPDELPEFGTTDDHVVAWLGRIDPIKDLGTLISAFRIVCDEIPDARLRLYGRTPPGNEDYRAELDALIVELGLEGSVTFEGGVAGGAGAYAEAQLAVLSSISEGFPYSIIEAMACGLPTVATGVGGVTEAQADTGVTVLPRSPDLLGEAVVKLLRDPERCRELGRKARQRVLDRFTLDLCLDNFRELYRELQDGLYRTSRHGHWHHRKAEAHPTAETCVVPTLPSAQTVTHVPASARPLTSSERERLVAAVGGAEALADAIDVDEVVATLESVGVTDDVADQTFGSPDVFDLAERLWGPHPEPSATGRPAAPTPAPPPGAQPAGPPQGPAPGRERPPRRPAPMLPDIRGALARGIVYVLPALTVGAASLRGAAHVSLLAASALGWGLAQGGGVLGYTVLSRAGVTRGLQPLRNGFAVLVAVIAAGGLAIGMTTSPAVGAAFALPLLHLAAACGLVMAKRTPLLLGLLAPVTALSVVAVVWPDSGAVRGVGTLSAATVVASLAFLTREVTTGDDRSGSRTLHRDDWVAALPMVLCGWLSAAFAVVGVRTLAHVDGLASNHTRTWLLVALPLWSTVVGCEWLLVRLRRHLRLLLHTTSTMARFRAHSRWSVVAGLECAAAALQVSVLVVTVVAATTSAAGDTPVLAAWQAATMFFLISLALLAVTVLCAASRTGPVIVGLGVATAALALVSSVGAMPRGLPDHTAGIVVCAFTATGLWVVAVRTLLDPSCHR